MKRIYNKVLGLIDSLIVLLHISKMRVAENVALIRKRKLINEVQWDKYTKLEFDTYWSKAYGKKIKNNGHRLYEAINGVHHKDYMPDFLFATKVEPFFNSYFYAKLYSDKSLTEILYDKCGTDVVLPKTHLVNSSGVLYNQKREVISKEEARAILRLLTDVVIK